MGLIARFPPVQAGQRQFARQLDSPGGANRRRTFLYLCKHAGSEKVIKKLSVAVCLSLVPAAPAPAYEAGTVQAESLAKSSTSWDGNRLPAYPGGTPEISVLRIRIPPGATLPMHRHPVINAGYLVRGELAVVTDENKTLHLKAGDALVEVVNTWHYGKNEGSEVAEIVVFYAGTPNAPVTVKK